MLNSLNKEIIKHNFSRAAKNYNQAALIQNHAAKKLCDLIIPSLKNNLKILDLGSGSGFIAKNIFQYNPDHEIYELDLSLPVLQQKNHHNFLICGDIEKLCFKPRSFDLLVSSFALQWLENFEQIFLDCFNLLKNGGIFAFCIPNNESLFELKTASVTSGCNFHFNNLPKTEDLKFYLEKSGFNLLNTYQEIITQEFDGNVEALKSIKEIGANYSKGLSKYITKSQLKKFDNFYLESSTNKVSKAVSSWTINYFILSK